MRASVIPVLSEYRIQNSVHMIGKKARSTEEVSGGGIQHSHTSQGADIIKATYQELHAPQPAQPPYCDLRRKWCTWSVRWLRHQKPLLSCFQRNRGYIATNQSFITC